MRNSEPPLFSRCGPDVGRWPPSRCGSNRGHLAARRPVEHHHAPRAERGEALVKRRPAHAVVDNVSTCAAGHPGDGRAELVVPGDIVGPGVAGQVRLLPARCRGDHHAAALFHHLGQQQPDTARGGVHHHDVPFAHRVGEGQLRTDRQVGDLYSIYVN